MRVVPVDTGLLKESIATKLHRVKGGQRRIDVGFKRPTSARAHLTEYGTAHSVAQPFMRPALDEGAHQALQIQRQAMAGSLVDVRFQIANRKR